MDKNQELAQRILESVGGQTNVSQVTHCMTRLRLNLVDDSIVDTNEVKKIPGVLGVSQKGGQYQIIIGQTVPHVYDAFMGQLEKSGITVSQDESEQKQVEKEPFSLKKLGNTILDGLAGSLTPLIPALVAVSMFKMVIAVFGPSMLGVIADGSQLYQLLTMVGDAGFYFFPILLGYTASKKLGTTPVLGMLLGAILVHPTLIQIATEGQVFSVYGISASAQNYSNTVIPIILSVWVMVYVEKFYKKIVPTTLATVFSPALAIATMLPIMLIVLGPIGFRLGEYLSRFLLSLDSVAGFLAVAVIAALWQFLVMTGMHLLLITTMITVFAQNGQEALVSPAAIVASICVAGMSLGSFLSLRKKDERALAFSFLVASFIGGVTEPALYGLGARYKKPFIGLIIGGLAGGVYAGITGVTTYAMIPVASFIAMTAFFGGTTANTINGLIACGIGFIISAGVTYVLGVKETKKEVELVEKNTVSSR